MALLLLPGLSTEGVCAELEARGVSSEDVKPLQAGRFNGKILTHILSKQGSVEKLEAKGISQTAIEQLISLEKELLPTATKMADKGVKVFIEYKGEKKKQFFPPKPKAEELLKLVKKELGVGDIGLELARKGSDVWCDVKDPVTLKTADILRVKQIKTAGKWVISLKCGGEAMKLEVEAGVSPEVLFSLIVEKSGCDAAQIKIEQYDEDLEDWAGVSVDEIEPEDGASFKVLNPTQKGTGWKISLECGGKTTTFEVAPEISPEALFQQLAEKSGVEASSMVLHQFDADLEDWAKVDVEEVEPEDGAKFRVEKSAGGNQASAKGEAEVDTPEEEDEPTTIPALPTGKEKFYCISMSKHIDVLKKEDHYKQLLAKKVIPSWIPDYRRWPEDVFKKETPLTVFFMNECPSSWRYNSDKIYRNLVMTIASGVAGWKNCFTIGLDQKTANIRVKFRDGGSWSAIGVSAQFYPKNEPTMVFDFANMTSNEIDATILHNFGHALGLGHALMSNGEWALLKKYVDPKKMVKSLNLSQEAELQSFWTGEGTNANYDPQSIMRYNAERSWLLDERGSSVSIMDEGPPKKVMLDFFNRLLFKKTSLSEHDRKSFKMARREIQEISQPISVIPIEPAKIRYLGKGGPKWEDVDFVKNRQTGETFKLSHKISSVWSTIGSRLGIEDDLLDSIMDDERKNMKCLQSVIKIWCDNAMQMPNKDEFPHTWDGFRTLLEDCDKSEAAKEYFEFLEKIPN